MDDQVDYRALYEEGRRVHEELRRVNEEQQRVIEEEREEKRRALLERDLDIRRARDAERDARAVNLRLAKENRELRQTTENLTLQPYLGLMSRQVVHLTRLLPFPMPEQATPAQASTSTSASTSKSKTKKSTTAGRTSIHGKYYPLRLCVWTDFPALHREAFSQIFTTLADRKTLPSHQTVMTAEKALLQKNPAAVLQMPGVLNELKTTAFLDVLLESPVSEVLRAYFSALSSDRWALFDNTMRDSESKTPSSPSASNNSPLDSLPRKTRPDCVVLAVPADAADVSASSEGAQPYRLLVGEHKPCHALRHTELTPILQGPMPETFMIRLAREALRRRKNKEAGLLRDMHRLSGEKAAPNRQSYFAYALTQTYDYMLLSGLEFGYVATGETLTFLRIPEKNPDILLYHTAVYPVQAPTDVASFSGPVTSQPPSTITDPVGEEALSALAISQLASLCVLAFASTPRSTEWVSHALIPLAVFPELPESMEAVPRSPSSLGTRRRDDDDSGDDDDPSRGRTLRPPGAAPSSTTRVPSPLQQVSMASSETHRSTSGAAGTTRGVLALKRRQEAPIVRPELPYCTQACLLGLVRRGPLDTACPNYQLHKQASVVEASPPLTPSGSGEDGDCDKHPCAALVVAGDPGLHPLSQAQLMERVRSQIFAGPEDHCESLDSQGHSGAIGHLFKITLKAFGYTFVGKAVEAHRRRRLERETAIYAQLEAQQGLLVPVHLGLMKLIAPYPLREQYLALPHMMLLSYAGPTLRSMHRAAEKSQLNDRVAALPTDLDWEQERTQSELEGLGLCDEDDRDVNFTWSAERQRAIRIDFDRASFAPPAAASARVLKREAEDGHEARTELPHKRQREEETQPGVA